MGLIAFLTPIWLRDRRQYVLYATGMIFVLAMETLFTVSPHVTLATDNYTPIPHFVDEKEHQDPCASLRGLEDVFVIIRTGSNEVYEKLPPLLNTTLPCFRHYGIWSDMEEEFEGHHIANSLDEIDPDLLEHHPEFEYYRHLQEHGRGDASSVETASWLDAPNTDLGRETPAWKLDKWKFLPIAKKAYVQHPTSKWYIFIECDTYVLWASLLAYLAKIDSSRPYYIGRQMNIAKDVFAYGGAGIIISNPAMAKLVEQHAARTEDYNKFTISQWAGDYVLSKVMLDAGIELSQVWPTLEGEAPAALDMKSGSTKGYPIWCYYVASYHHMTPDDIYAYYDFDRSWDVRKRGFPRHGDVFRHMLYPEMRHVTYGWDNLSSDVKSENASLAECQEICWKQPGCMQFSLTGRTCKTSTAAKLGRQQRSGERVDSGWIKKRLKSYMNKMDTMCKKQDWVLPP